MTFLRIEGLRKRFGATAAVDGVDLEIGAGELFALLGGSGCGKSTMLRLLAGLERPDAGRILLQGRDMAGVPPHLRPVNTMFQSYALFPHMDVARNVGYGLRMAGAPQAEVAARVEEMLALVRLEGFGARRPHQLSGGQRARVALARALARRPLLLLLDEPLSALDRGLREAMRLELRRIQEGTGTTFILVTHDQEEAMAMASRLALMEAGRLVQVGTPAEVWARPNSRFAARFLGAANVLDGVAQAGVLRAGGIAVAPQDGVADGPAAVALRPERLRIAPAAAGHGAGRNEAVGEVRDVAFLGDGHLVVVAAEGGAELRVGLPAEAPAPARGARVVVAWDGAAAVVLRG